MPSGRTSIVGAREGYGPSFDQAWGTGGSPPPEHTAPDDVEPALTELEEHPELQGPPGSVAMFRPSFMPFVMGDDQHVVTTAAAMAAQEATREVSAFKVVLKCVDYIFRQRCGVRALGVREEGCQLFTDDAVKHRVVRAVGNIFGGWNEGLGNGHAAAFAPGVPDNCPGISRSIVASAPGAAMAEGGGRHSPSCSRSRSCCRARGRAVVLAVALVLAVAVAVVLSCSRSKNPNSAAYEADRNNRIQQGHPNVPPPPPDPKQSPKK